MYKSKYKKASSRITRRNKLRRIFGLFLKIGSPVIFFICLIFLARADFLQVKNFEVSGAEILPTQDIERTASKFISGNKFLLIPRSNIFLLSKDNLTAALLSKFGRLQEVKVNKQFFSRSIELSVAERKTDFLWCSPQDECFAMSGDGLIFENSLETSGKIIFRGILNGNPLMKNFATLERMQNYLNLINIFISAGFEVGAINIESSDKAVIETSIGDVIFSPEEADLSLTAQNVILLVNEVRNKNSNALFQYIDARFGHKIFYKLK